MSTPPYEAPQPLLAGLRRNATTQFGARAVGMLGQAVALAIVARGLGPAQYGAFALVSSLTLMANVLTDWGLLLIGARGVATRPDEARRLLRALLGLRLALGAAGLVLVVGLAFAASDSGRVHLAAAIAGLSFFPGAWFAAAHVLAQADLRMERMAVPLLLGSLSSMAWLLVTHALGGGVVALSWCFLVAAVVTAVASIVMAPGGLPLVPARDREFWGRLLRESTPVGLSLMFVTVYFYVDALLLARLSSTTQLGLYDAAYRFVQLGPLVPSVLVTSVFALAARYADTDLDRMREFVREFASVIALLLPLPLLALATIPGELVRFIYGAAYADAGPVLAILAVAITLMIASGVVGPLLVALGRERATLVISAGAAALNIAANCALIPLLDARGAAIATVATEALVLAVGGVLVARALRPRLDAVQLAKVALAGAAAAAVVWALPGHVLLRLTAGLVVYVVLLVATRAAGRRQLELTRAAPSATSVVA